jgi:Concanavalin A-like lectin/glucanases superfamily
MPCTAPVRGKTDTKYPWDPDIQNDPCGGKALQRTGLVPPSSAEGMVAYWPLDDAGPTLAGTVPGIYTPTGITYQVDGPPQFPGSKAVRFDGAASSWGNIPYSAAFDVADIFTLECWFRPLSLAATGGLFSRDTQQLLRVQAGTGNVLLAKYGGSQLVASTAGATLGAWNHVIVTKNGATALKMYLNGVDVTGAVTDQTFAAAIGTGIKIGAWAASPTSLNGDQYGLAVYNAYLTPAQAQAHYLGKDVSADSLCTFHYQMKYGQNAVRQPIVVEP